MLAAGAGAPIESILPWMSRLAGLTGRTWFACCSCLARFSLLSCRSRNSKRTLLADDAVVARVAYRSGRSTHSDCTSQP